VLRASAFTVVLLCSPNALAVTFSLSAHPGYFNAKTIGHAGAKSVVSGSMRIVKFNGGHGWPPAAYVGVQRGASRDESVQFLVIRNKETDSYLVVGYRVIQGGKETTVKSLANLPLGSAVTFSLVFDRGIITWRMNDRDPITVRAPFTEATPYVSVSSGIAEFKVDP
jgi:hypothetical protein